MPVLAFYLQRMIWPQLPLLTWLFFYPAIFLSAWIGRLLGGVIATGLATIFNVYFFKDPQFSWDIYDHRNVYSVAIFIASGVMYSLVFEWLHRSSTELLRIKSLGLEIEHGPSPETGRLSTMTRYLKLIHPEDCAAITTWDEDCLAGKNPAPIEYRIFPKAGEERSLLGAGILETDDSGNPLHMIGIIQDFTETKRLETEMKCWGDAFRHCAHGIAIYDPKTQTLVTCNPAFVSILGYAKPDEVEGMAILSLYQHESVEQLKTYTVIADQFGKVRFETVFQRKDGSSVDAQVDLVSVKDKVGDILYRIATVQDITERKKTENQLRKLAKAVQQSPESIIITDSNGYIEYVNEAFFKNSGYTPDEVIGMTPKILNSGKTPLATYADLWKTISSGQAWSGEFINKHKDSTETVELANITPIRQSDGKITHYVAVQEDITQKKRVADELEQHRHHLEELVVNRTQELIDAQALAESANKAKSAYLANMSHEIRTPMNAILGLSYLLQKSKLSTEQQKYLHQIDTSSQHLLSIINDILDLSKIESGQLKLEDINFSLEAIFDHISSILIDQARQKGVSLEFDCGDVPVWLHGDPTRLRQALINFAVNALKFTEQGKISVRAKILKGKNKDLFLRFEVQDTGIGISEENLPKLFEAFNQADLSTTRQYGGTGLGLAITKHLAKAMGGEIGVESKLGQGSLFWFTAVLRKGQDTAQGNRVNQPRKSEKTLRANFSGIHILLVEDNAINREVALAQLHAVGLSVDKAENGRIALDKIKNNAYDLVLMDIQMPEMDGLTATKEIRTLPEFENLPIIAMTANAFSEDINAALAAGMNDCIVKPVAPELLYTKLLQWLSGFEENLTTEGSSYNVCSF